MNSNDDNVRDGNTASFLPCTTFRNHSTAVRTIGGSNERSRHRPGVRFDLDNSGNGHGHNGVTGPSTGDDRQHSMQLYFDLAGNLKKVRCFSTIFDKENLFSFYSRILRFSIMKKIYFASKQPVYWIVSITKVSITRN